MKRNILDATFTIVSKWEQFRENPYYATEAERKKNLLTIGYGFTTIFGRKVLITDRLNKDQATQMLLGDIEALLSSVEKLINPALSPNQYVAIVSLIFNIGLPAFKKSTMLKLLNQGHVEDAAKQFDKWVYQDKVKLQGLVFRRWEEKQLFLTP